MPQAATLSRTQPGARAGGSMSLSRMPSWVHTLWSKRVSSPVRREVSPNDRQLAQVLRSIGVVLHFQVLAAAVGSRRSLAPAKATALRPAGTPAWGLHLRRYER